MKIKELIERPSINTTFLGYHWRIQKEKSQHKKFSIERPRRALYGEGVWYG